MRQTVPEISSNKQTYTQQHSQKTHGVVTNSLFSRAEILSDTTTWWRVRLKPYAVSSIRCRGTKCTLERKTLEHRRTSGHLQFLDAPLLYRNPDISVAVPKKYKKRAL